MLISMWRIYGIVIIIIGRLNGLFISSNEMLLYETQWHYRAEFNTGKNVSVGQSKQGRVHWILPAALPESKFVGVDMPLQAVKDLTGW